VIGPLTAFQTVVERAAAISTDLSGFEKSFFWPESYSKTAQACRRQRRKQRLDL